MTNAPVENTEALPRFPITILSTTLLVAIFSLILLGAYDLYSIKEIQHIINTDLKATESQGLIQKLQKDSAMSARMAVATGEKKWKERYREQHAALARVTEAVNSEYWARPTEKSNLAKNKINAMEALAFNLLEHGNLTAAKNILFSTEYEVQQATQAAEVEKYVSFMKKEANSHLSNKILEVRYIIAAILVSLFLLIGGWIYSYKNMAKLKKIKEHELTLEELLYRDQVTGIYNRFYFSENLARELKKAQKNRSILAMAHIDLDRFGQINIHHGQGLADKLLNAIAIRLKTWVKDEKYLARLGNDEFTILITDCYQLSDIEAALIDLMRELREPFIIGKTKLYITTSIGVSLYPDHTNRQDSLMKCADLALFHCKESGGNDFKLYHADLDKPVNKQLETELHHALENHEFELHYQPIISANEGKIVCVEALLRWHHPGHGLLTPDSFIKLCEKNGLIIPIGAWILRTACEQIKTWHKMGYPDLCVSVNLSPRQFNHSGLLDLISKILATYEIPPDCLRLEITESLMMQDTETNIALLKSLRNLGLQLSLDDFGTGYSSLNYLKYFPFSILKIDKSFVSDITLNTTSAAIVEAIIALGKSLKLTLVAEGVETGAQFNMLKKMNCDLVQGYYCSKAIPVNEFTQLLRNDHTVYK